MSAVAAGAFAELLNAGAVVKERAQEARPSRSLC
jgi:hypothetical protein